MSSEFERLQALAIPKAEENKAGEQWGQPGTPPTSRERLLKKASLPGGQQVTSVAKGSPSPHAAQGVNLEKLAEVGGNVHPDDEDPINPGPFGPKLDTGLHPAQTHDNFDPMSPFPDEGMEVRAELEAHGLTYDDVAPRNIPKVQFPGTPRQLPVRQATCDKCLFLKKEELVVFELKDGTFQVPCIDVRAGRMSVAVMLSTTGMNFIPKPGTKLEITYKENSWTCYYPGTYTAYDELGVTVIHFIREETE